MPRSKKFRSIRVKLVFLLSLSAIIALTLSSISIFSHSYYKNKSETIRSLSHLTSIMAQNLTATLEFDDSKSADAILRTLQIQEYVKGAFIFKNDKSIFSSYTRAGLSEKTLTDTLRSTYSSNDMKKEISHISVEDIIVSMPIFSDNEYLASFTIISDTNYLHETIKEEFLVQLIVSIVSLAVIVILAFKLQGMFTLPIFRLKENMEFVTLNNRYDTRVSHDSNDEFIVLFDGFNNMMDTINNRTAALNEAKKEIEAIHKNTKKSIEYAALIQGALVPNHTVFRNYFTDYFTIWHPKDIVGGDIYLFEELRDANECLLMVIDCTGHGVPGAFVTMLVKAIERQIISEINNSDQIVSPSNILNIFNKSMKHLLKQEQNSISNAGFDGQVMYYNKHDAVVKVASARNDIFYIQNNQINTVKGDRHSIGYKDSDINFKFTEHTIDVKNDTTIYLGTDGYWDQIGGEKALPFGKKRFKKLLQNISDEPLAEQQEEFLYTLQKYQENHDRNDDITLIGIRI